MGIGLPHTHDAHALLIRPRSPVNRSERRRAAAPGRLDRRELPLYSSLPRRRLCWAPPSPAGRHAALPRRCLGLSPARQARHAAGHGPGGHGVAVLPVYYCSSVV